MKFLWFQGNYRGEHMQIVDSALQIHKWYKRSGNFCSAMDTAEELVRETVHSPWTDVPENLRFGQRRVQVHGGAPQKAQKCKQINNSLRKKSSLNF